MKKLLAVSMAAALSLSLFVGCTQEETTDQTTDQTTEESTAGEETTQETEQAPAEGEELVTVRVGATPTPHGEILSVIQDDLAEAGINLEIVEFTDYIQPNVALDSGELDANFFQHLRYLEDYNESNGTTLTSVASIHYEPLGIYPGKTASIEELQDGAQIAVPNDPTNGARALLLLEEQGLITLDPEAGFKATVLDITENPKNLDFIEIDPAQLARSLQDVDLAVINGNYALQAGLDAAADALAKEEAESDAAKEYPNVLVVRESDTERPEIKALVDALQSDEVRDFINENYQGSVVPLF